ncbi:MAG: IS5 family transposase, partial [Nitrosopumilaceae archaeon]
YNEKLVRRGEILISYDVMKSWDKELAEMNRKKKGRRFLFPDSFMKIVGYAKVYFGLPYRQTEGLLRTYGNAIPKVPDYIAIHKRINKLDIRQTHDTTGNNIVLAIDSTGIKVTNRGDWMRHKWNLKRRGYLKIHVGVDVSTRQILALKMTDERSHDSKHLPYLVSASSRHGTVSKVMGDGAYDTKEIFSYLDDNHIIPAIKVRKNSIPKARGCYPRKVTVISQLADFKKWSDSVSYGSRWIVESIFSAIKRMFGEEVRSKKRRNMLQELRFKVSLYNRFVTA